MMVANATGCSSIYGGSAPSTPYTKNSCGEGPAWASSLFEDNAEYGYGMFQAVNTIRQRMAKMMSECEKEVSPELADLFVEWRENINDADKTAELRDKILPLLEAESGKTAKELLELKHYLVKKSIWMFGGDGWAYDIGYGGLDHVLASGQDINVLVLDTEVYSNTGGQASKSTPASAVAKFDAGGKVTKKKDLGLMAMSYGYVYVAQVALGANPNQTLTAIREAEAYQGPSIIICYCPCIEHHMKSSMGLSMLEEKKAVEAGYWHLYRYNPDLKAQGKAPFILDSKKPSGDFQEFLMGENRFASLKLAFPEKAEALYKKTERDSQERYRTYAALAERK